MEDELKRELKNLLEFESVKEVETIQSLWSGYGSLLRVKLSGGPASSVIVKRITPPMEGRHPRGWNSSLGHQRKLRSYEVESFWYQHFAARCDERCRVPNLLGWKSIEGGSLLVLEDLDQAGFPNRKSDLDSAELKSCLSWLAHFHAQFLHTSSQGLWPIGTYWQLETRSEEYEKMPKGALKETAFALHEKLKACKFQTLVHGDAKYANFCFGEKGVVAAVDFQYVGGGCGMKDVAYLLSCVPNGLRASTEKELLNFYFSTLGAALTQYDMKVDLADLESEWQPMYAIARADFERFLQGWAPGHWKSDGYAQSLVDRALQVI